MRGVVLALVLIAGSSGFAQAAPSDAADTAAQLLARHGSVPVTAAGPYVMRGTFRVQVSAKLGAPDAILADGTWMYHQHRIDDSRAEGTLLVRFNESGRVGALLLVTPAAALALRDELAKHRGTNVASRRPR